MTSRFRSGLLIVLDGFGIAPDGPGNAISQARTPRWEALRKKYPYTELNAAGRSVGLPPGIAGNSEVGHLTLGAGRIVDQDLARIQRLLALGALHRSKEWSDFLSAAIERRSSTVHLVGLVSDGFVHSSLEHLHAFLHELKTSGVSRINVHAITDGRDSGPTSGREALSKVQHWLSEIGVGSIATVCGRFFAMDRDRHWERTAQYFNLLVNASAEHVYSDPLEAVDQAYNQRITDEFVPPSKSRAFKGIQDGDLVLFFNFRADRMRQISQALLVSEFSAFPRPSIPALKDCLTLTHYEDPLPVNSIFPRDRVRRTLGEVVSGVGGQLRIAETEKYAHVTYFFSGGQEEPFAGEKRILVPSLREVRTYDERPEMSAGQILECALEALDRDRPVMSVINFANADMIAHTGNVSATIRSVETVDRCLSRLVDWVENQDAFALITSDHGNAEQMLSADGGPCPSHTASPVPFLLVDPSGRALKLKPGGLADVAPTFLELQGIRIPDEMDGTSLIQR